MKRYFKPQYIRSLLNSPLCKAWCERGNLRPADLISIYISERFIYKVALIVTIIFMLFSVGGALFLSAWFIFVIPVGLFVIYMLNYTAWSRRPPGLDRFLGCMMTLHEHLGPALRDEGMKLEEIDPHLLKIPADEFLTKRAERIHEMRSQKKTKALLLRLRDLERITSLIHGRFDACGIVLLSWDQYVLAHRPEGE